MEIRKISLSVVVGIVATTFFALLSVPARAQSPNGGREIRVSVLGSSNRFSPPVGSVDELHAMVNAHHSELTHVLALAGMANLSTPVLNTLSSGHVTTVTIVPGTHINWMAIRRSGTPTVLQNVRWTGRQPFEAWQFAVRASGVTYNFIVPKVCGNLSLLDVGAPPPVITRATPPPPPPYQPPVTPVARTPIPPPAYVAATPYDDDDSHRPWFASAFIGASLDTSVDLFPDDDVSSSLAFGGQIGYMWWSKIGTEFLATFAPSVGFDNVFLADNPHVNTYMANVVGSIPFGSEHQFRPYVSGGLGAITLHTSFFSGPRGVDTISASDA